MKKKTDKISESIKQYLALNTPLFGNKNMDLEYCESEVCFSEGCNVTNLPQVYDIILEKSKKIDNVIKKLLNRINARIYKTKEIRESWTKKYMELTDLDGVKIDFESTWVHLRKSNTEPIVRIYTEAPTQAEADDLAAQFVKKLEAFS